MIVAVLAAKRRVSPQANNLRILVREVMLPYRYSLVETLVDRH